MSEFLNNLWDVHNKNAEGLFGPQRNISTVYHYTSLESAVKIIESGKLRFTSARYLNDPKELELGLEILREVFNEQILVLKEKGFLITVKLLVEVASAIDISLCGPDQIEEKHKFWDVPYNPDMPHAYPIHVYVVSFSHSEDSLGQWLAYGDRCLGASVGLSFENNVPPLDYGRTPLYWGDVNYAKLEDKKRFARNELLRILEYLTSGGKQDWQPEGLEFKEWYKTLGEIFLIDVINCKEPFYSEEKEFRIIFPSHQSSKKNFIVKDNLIKPYIEFNLKKEGQHKILLGCRSAGALNRRSLSELKQQYGYLRTSVVDSKISFRG